MKYKNQLIKKVNFYNLTLLGLAVLLIVGITLNFYYFRSDVRQSSLQEANTEVSAQLKTYEEGYASVINNYYSGALNEVETIASDAATLQAVQSNDTASLSSAFDHAQAYNRAFDTLAAFGVNGNVLAISTDAPSVAPGLSVSTLNPVVQSAIRSRIPVVCPGYLSSTHRLVISFVAPITSAKGAYEGSIVGNTTLESLDTYTNYFDKRGVLTGTLVDSSGQVLVSGASASTSLATIATKEPLLWYADHTSAITVRSETNYLGQNVFAAGSKVVFPGSGDVYALSFVPESYTEAVASQSEDTTLSLYREFLGINVFSILTTVTLVYFVVRFKKKDKRTPSQEIKPK